MPELWELAAEEIARRVRAREVSAAEVLESCLARTARVEPLIRAYLEIFEDEARARAAEVDRRLAAGEDGQLDIGLRNNRQGIVLSRPATLR